MLPHFNLTSWEKPYETRENRRANPSVKSLARTHLQKGFHRNHRPMIGGFSKTGRRWIDGGGRQFPPGFTDRRVSTVRLGDHGLDAVVNHYATRSLEGFFSKVARGASSAGERNRQDATSINKWIQYWAGRNKSEYAKDAKRFKPPLFDAFFAEIMRDPIIAELQKMTLAHHRDCAKEILATDFGGAIAAGLNVSYADIAEG